MIKRMHKLCKASCDKMRSQKYICAISKYIIEHYRPKSELEYRSYNTVMTKLQILHVNRKVTAEKI